MTPLLPALMIALTAAAGPVDDDGATRTVRRVTPRPLAGWSLVELRGGITTHGDAGTTLCGEISPWRYIAIESCGSGAGFWDDRTNVTEMVHFRLEARLPIWTRGAAEVSIEPGIGFAEIEQGRDEPGFRFGPATSNDQREGAGVAGSLGIKARLWPHERFFGTTELSGGAAIVPSAPTVTGNSGTTVPFLLWTVGAGF